MRAFSGAPHFPGTTVTHTVPMNTPSLEAQCATSASPAHRTQMSLCTRTGCDKATNATSLSTSCVSTTAQMPMSPCQAQPDKHFCWDPECVASVTAASRDDALSTTSSTSSLASMQTTPDNSQRFRTITSSVSSLPTLPEEEELTHEAIAAIPPRPSTAPSAPVSSPTKCQLLLKESEVFVHMLKLRWQNARTLANSLSEKVTELELKIASMQAKYNKQLEAVTDEHKLHLKAVRDNYESLHKADSDTIQVLERTVQDAMAWEVYRVTNSHYAIALADFAPRDDMELALKKGQLLTLIGSIDEDGFYHAEIPGASGLVPSTYVQCISSIDDCSAQSTA
eukprot:m.284488 g.284488  ORF g.284488 m.284488 type:complete len:338 (-) comp15762_c0_seq2:291-1304(-)